MPDLQWLSLFPEEMAEEVKRRGYPAFRAKQLFSWLHKGADFGGMSNLPKDMLTDLAKDSIAQPAVITHRQVSQADGTQKYLYTFADGNAVEGVLMRYKHGLTLCISTQVGCKMGCAFCASTLDGCIRNLSAGEMLGEVLAVNRELQGEAVHNIVLMGSGEPLDNYEQVVRFLRLISHPDGLNISPRRVSLSTCGIVDKMHLLAQEKLPVTLSVSLHAPDDATRLRIMPIAKAWPMDKLMEACRAWVEITGRRIVFEYALIDGVNSEGHQAKKLSQLLRGLQCHVNLIPLNDVKERDLKGVSRQEAEAFLRELENNHISATIRREMGSDIQGACGQLRRRVLKLPSGEGQG